MSYESYDDRSYRSDRHRRDRPAYREEEIVEARTGPRRHTELVRRRSDSVEEVEREFPPGEAYIQRRTTTRRAHSDGRGRHDNAYYKDKQDRNRRYDDRKGMNLISLAENRTDVLQVIDEETTHLAPALKAGRVTIAASH